jgi:hypothetical protein
VDGVTVGGLMGGEDDENVDHYVIVPTPYGLYVSVSPKMLGVYTRFSHFISVSP